MGGANFGAFLGGMSQGKQRGRENEKQDLLMEQQTKQMLAQAKLIEAQTKLANLGMSAKEADMQMAAEKQAAMLDYIERRRGGGGADPNAMVGQDGGMQSTQFGGFGNQQPTGVIDQIAELQGGPQQGRSNRGSSGMEAAIVKELFGLDAIGAGRMDEQGTHNQNLEAMAEKRYQANNLVAKTITDKFGNTYEVFVDRTKQGPMQTKSAPALSLSDIGQLQKGGERLQPRGQTLQDVSAGGVQFKKEGLPLEAAAKTSGMQSGIQGIKQIQAEIINPDGTIDRSKLWQMKPLPFMNSPMPDWAVGIANSVMGKKPQPAVGQMFFTHMAQATESLIRGESGAAVPDTEIIRLLKRYGIDWTQDDETIKGRMNALLGVLGGTIELIDPNQRHRFGKEDITYRVKQNGEKEYIGLPDEQGFTVGAKYYNAEGDVKTYMGKGKWEE